MAALGQTIVASELPQASSIYDPLPAGWYTARITQAEVTPTKDGSGEYIKIRYDILGPTGQGRVVFGNLNIRNKSAKAEEIGRQQLGELMRAIGLARVSDSDELVGAELSIKLEIRPERTDPMSGKVYQAQNEIKGWKSTGGGSPAAVAQAPAAAAAPGKAAPPWAKR